MPTGVEEVRKNATYPLNMEFFMFSAIQIY